jgi:putative ABC transport system permease protein
MWSQIVEITLMNLRNVGSRLGSSSVIVVGIAGVVAVLVGLLSMASGFTAALTSTSDPNRALVLRDGANAEMSSSLSREELNVVSRLEGVRRASGELFVVVDIPKRAGGTPANVIARGVPAEAFEVRPEVAVVEGRRFESGRTEMIVGVKAAAEFAGLEVGDTLDVRDSAFVVVGQFTAGGGPYESEVWIDLPVAQTAFRRGGTFSSMRVELESASVVAELQKTIADDPRLDLSLTPETEFYAAQSQSRAELIDTFGYLVATIMAIGAVFAALNTMYSAVSTRSVEIATLRALGFGAVRVVVSVMIDALALALIGGVLGGILVRFFFDGFTASTINGFSQVAFAFAVTPRLLELGLAWALLLGLVGGLFPAVRSARLPITTALRGE